ncbi:MAG: BspA family leucine-rich repeat surface protein [Cyclobacteriaceae bacterium]
MSRYFFQTFFSFVLVVTAQGQNSYQLFTPTGDGNSDSFYAADSAMVYSNSDVTGTIEPLSSSIDFGYNYGISSEASLVSPSSYPFYDLSSNWSVQKTTLFRETTLTETDFNSYSEAALYDAFQAGTNQEESKTGLSVGQVIAFVTNNGNPANTRVGLILIEEIQGTFNVGDFIRFKIKDDPMRPFITTWQTTTASESITIPTTGTGYDYSVNWGDGTVQSGYTGDASYTYASAGTYTVSITGDFPRIYFNGGEEGQDKDKIITIEQWGDIQWSSMYRAFRDCDSLQLTANDVPDLSNVTDLYGMFEGTDKFNGDISSWDVSNVTRLTRMFAGAISFNCDLNSWDVSNVTDFGQTFIDADKFNGDITSWDISSAISLYGMFQKTEVFNQDIGNWNTSNVTTMERMFRSSKSFNQDIGDWDVSKVTNMSNFIKENPVFNQDLSAWDVSNVTNMNAMFDKCYAFNQDLGSWDISSITGNGMDWMFNYLSGMSQYNYDQTLAGWARLDPGENQIPENITFSAENVFFCESADARQRLIDDYGWNISGDDYACSGLIAYYPFDGNGNDSTNNNHDGTVNGAVLTTDRFGNDSSAYFFDGVNDDIGISSPDVLATFNSPTFSLSTWYNGGEGINEPIVSSGNTSGVSLVVEGSDLKFSFNGVSTYQTSGDLVAMNRWYHLAATYDGSTLSLYIDGALISSHTESWSTIASTGPVEIGSDGSQYAIGRLDDIKIYSSTLSATEIQDLYYEGGYSPPVEITVSDVDGNDYSGVVIGTQVWMGENLATTKLNNGTDISNVTDNTAWSNLTTPGYSWFDNDEVTYKDKYGALYNWYVVESGDACPIGWHVPSDTEFNTLENYMISNGFNYDGTTSGNKIAKALGDTFDWLSSSVEGAVGNTDYPQLRNKSGFSARPSGWRYDNGTFSGSRYIDIWTSTEISSTNAIDRYIFHDNIDLKSYNYNKKHGFAIRCLRDASISTATTIKDFTLPGQAGSVVIDSTNFIVTLTGLSPNNAITPEITLSDGATISPASGVSMDFTTAFTYEVTAEDRTTTQTWTVHASLDSGLVAYYPFNGNANDESGNGNDGTVGGAVLTTDRLGLADKAYLFDGSFDSIRFNTLNDIPIGDAPYTISAWIKPSSMGALGTGGGIIGWGDYASGSNKVNALRLTGNGVVNYWWSNDLEYTTGDLVDNWHHIVATYDGTTRSIYTDGSLGISDTPADNNILSASNMTIGKTFSEEFFNGVIDDVRIYNQALSSDQISALYEQEKIPISITVSPISATRTDKLSVTFTGIGGTFTTNTSTCSATIYHLDASLTTESVYLENTQDNTIRIFPTSINASSTAAGTSTFTADFNLANAFPGNYQATIARDHTCTQVDLVSDFEITGTITPVTVGFEEDFESGSLDAKWSTASSITRGRVDVSTLGEPFEGNYSLTMDANPSGLYNINKAEIEVDISSAAANTEFGFWFKEYSDEYHVEDGIYISADGTNYHKIEDLGGVNYWEYHRMNLRDEANDLGLSTANPIKVRIQQHDNFPIPTDGFGVDEMAVYEFDPEVTVDETAGYQGETLTVSFVGSGGGVFTTNTSTCEKGFYEVQASSANVRLEGATTVTPTTVWLTTVTGTTRYNMSNAFAGSFTIPTDAAAGTYDVVIQDEGNCATTEIRKVDAFTVLTFDPSATPDVDAALLGESLTVTFTGADGATFTTNSNTCELGVYDIDRTENQNVYLTNGTRTIFPSATTGTSTPSTTFTADFTIPADAPLDLYDFVIQDQNGCATTGIVESDAFTIASDSAAITSFSIANQEGVVISAADHTVAVTMPFQTSPTSLTPEIGLSRGATSDPLTDVAQDFSSPVTYTVTANNDDTQDWTVTVTNAQNDSTDITLFVIASGDGHPEPVEGTIDASTHTVTATMPYGTNLSSLSPTISVSTNATISPESGAAQDFSSAVTYTVTAENGDTQDWIVSFTNLENDSTDIKSFVIASGDGHPEPVEGTIDTSTHTVTATVPYGSSLTSLTPTITVSGDATISPASGEAQDFTSSVTYLVTAQNDSTQEWVVTLTNALNDSTDMLSFVIASGDGLPEPVEGTIDTSAHTITATVPFGTDLTSLAPTITYSTGASISPESGTEQDFTSTVTYTVTAANGDTQEWTVKLMQTSPSSSDSTDITTFSITNQISSTVSVSDSSVTVYVPDTLDLTNLSPIFELSEGAILKLDTIVQESGVSVVDFTNPVMYYVIAENGTDSMLWQVTVLAVEQGNSDPTSILLSADSVYEEQGLGEFVGLLSAEDPDEGDEHVYRLVAGDSANHNVLFDLRGDSLVTAFKLDYEQDDHPYLIRVQADDGGGGILEKGFSIRVIDIDESGNNRPFDILLSSDTISENRPEGSLVGRLSTRDPDANDTHVYTVTQGGDEFEMVGDELRSTVEFDFEIKDDYFIEINTQDGAGENFKKTFTIFINDVVEVVPNQGPTGILLSNQMIPESEETDYEVGILTLEDEDNDGTQLFTILSGSDEFSIDGNVLKTSSVIAPGGYDITVEGSDGELSIQEDFRITVEGISTLLNDFTAIVDEQGKKQENYRIISVPVNSIGLGAFFSGLEIANLNKTWRILNYSTTNGATDLASTASLRAGEGYWFAADQDIAFEIPKGNQWARLNDQHQFEMELVEGWNMIGNPFMEELDWAAVIQWNVDQEFITQDDFDFHDYNKVFVYNGAFKTETKLKRFEGGFVKVNRSLTIYIPKHEINTAGRAGDEAFSYFSSNEAWGLQIDMTHGKRATNLTGIGMNSQSHAGKDRWDLEAPPTLGNKYAFELTETKTGLSRNVVAPHAGFTWTYTLNASEPNVTLLWNNESLQSMNQPLVVHLPETGQAFDMKTINSLDLETSKINTLQFIYGTDALLDNLVIPVQVYPNPMKTRTTFRFYTIGDETQPIYINIYSVSGALIERLTYRAAPNQWTELSWQPNSEIRAGVYLYQISHDGYQSSMNRLILTK